MYNVSNHCSTCPPASAARIHLIGYPHSKDTVSRGLQCHFPYLARHRTRAASTGFRPNRNGQPLACARTPVTLGPCSAPSPAFTALDGPHTAHGATRSSLEPPVEMMYQSPPCPPGKVPVSPSQPFPPVFLLPPHQTTGKRPLRLPLVLPSVMASNATGDHLKRPPSQQGVSLCI